MIARVLARVPRGGLLTTLRQSGAFVIIGLLATGTHASAALGAEALLSLEPLYANLVGYCTAVGVSYFGHAWLTFRTPALQRAQFLRLVAVSLSGLLLNQLIVYVATHVAGWPLWAALIPATLLVPVFTFVVSKLWAFKGRAAGDAQGEAIVP